MKNYQKAFLRAEQMRDMKGIHTYKPNTFVAPKKTIRKFKCVEGEIFRFNESTGKYDKYDYMENIPGITLKF